MKLAEFQKVGAMLAKQHKISVIQGNSWAANIKERKVFYKKEDIYNLSEEHILGFTLHEIAHIHYTGDVPTPPKNKELTHSTLNMLEDIAIESIIANDYPNAGEILQSTKQEVIDTLVKMLPKMEDVSVYEKSLLYAATKFEGRGYAFSTEPYEKLGDKISTIMFKRQKEIYGRKHTKDLIPIAQEIVDLIIKEAGEPNDDEKRQLMQSAEDEGKQAGKEQSQGNAKQAIIDGLKKAGSGWELGEPIEENIVFIDQITDQAQRIGKELRTVLKRNNAMEFGGRYRSGKLLAKRFVRIKALKDRNPFARRITKSNKSYAFAIASDVSGSMFGNAYKETSRGSYALSSMHMVGEALRIAGVPRAMIIFGDNAKTVAPMGKTQIRWEQLINKQSINSADTGGTRINEAIIACTKELSKIKAERKIMIVLTDGQSDLENMQEAQKKAVKEGIECLGIEIGSYKDCTTYMDKTFSPKKVTKVEDTRNTSLIGKAFIDILKHSITKSIS